MKDAAKVSSLCFNTFNKMMLGWLLPLALIVTMPCSKASDIGTNNHMTIKTKTFEMPPIGSTPGLVNEKFFYHIDFPRGHIAIKSFSVEVVDESGNQIPLSQTYLHHWALLRYYQHKNATDPNTDVSYAVLKEPDFIVVSNNGVCQKSALESYYAMGSESREISTFLPDPYGIEVGNAEEVPEGYEERWSINVHTIDTRGVEDKVGCIECRCGLYNITKDRFGKALRADYKGGLYCCYDKTECRVSSSYEGRELRKMYVRYRVKWVNWDDDLVVPVKVYLFDVTDTYKSLPDSTGLSSHQHHCRVEYDIEACSLTNKVDGECIGKKVSKVIFPENGYLVYGVAHQHIGATGATFHGEDGRILCSSSPIYGRGNEEGYVVGMRSCYPKPGSVKVKSGETVTFVSNYNSTHSHTGVMGIFHIMVAQKVFKSSLAVEPPNLITQSIM